MQIRVLGPVDVIDDAGGAHRPHSPLRSSILALLAMSAGRMVTADRLLDMAWNGQPPKTGRRALRFHMSRLRSELEVVDIVVTDGHGYRTNASVDADFIPEALAGTAFLAWERSKHFGDPTGVYLKLAFRELSGALALWRGEVCEDAEPSAVIDDYRRRLSQDHLSLLERLFRCRIAMGDSSACLAGLDSVCRDHLLHEGLWATKALAEYRSGMQADAVRTIATLRENLVDQVGASPTPRFEAFETQLLNHADSLELSLEV